MSRRQSAAVVLAAVVSANIPDLPFPGWGHAQYRISHSLVVGAGLIATTAALCAVLPKLRRRLGGWPVFFVCAAALLSHYILDSLYNHGKGIAIFWPFSDGRLALPVPWFSTLGSTRPALSWHVIRTCTIELVCFGGLLAVVLSLRRAVRTRCDRRPHV